MRAHDNVHMFLLRLKEPKQISFSMNVTELLTLQKKITDHQNEINQQLSASTEQKKLVVQTKEELPESYVPATRSSDPHL